MDINDIDDEMQEGINELHLLIMLFTGQVWHGATAEEAIGHIAKYGELLAPAMAEQLDPATGPKASFFRIVGRAMWNNLPQPTQDFRLTKLPECSQGLLQQNFANLPFEKSISVYPQNLWITLWMVINTHPLTWRCIRVFLTLPIFCIATISIKNNMLP